MTLLVIQGTIARRILVNYRADTATVARLLPPPFRPKLHEGWAIIGVCLIRLEAMRPLACALPSGVSSENAAHRIAIEWDDEAGNLQEGVFIPRRDTGSLLNHLGGGRIFPGQHQLADFKVRTSDTEVDFQMRSRDGQIEVEVKGRIGNALPPTSCFASLAEASTFFEGGCIGFSVRHGSTRLDGLRLQTDAWHVETLDVSEVYSSFFADETRFPPGSVTFDHALLMRGLTHRWHSVRAPQSVKATCENASS